MTEFEFTSVDVTQKLNGDYELKLIIPKRFKIYLLDFLQTMQSNKKQMIARLLQKTNKRSLDANAYLWVICSKIADALNSTKEEIYMESVRKKGRFEIVPVRDDVLEFWIGAWKEKGLGWHSEVFAKAKKDGYTNTINYYGSSVYDTKSMSLLIDYIVSEAKELGIETLSPEELERMKGEWGNGN